MSRTVAVVIGQDDKDIWLRISNRFIPKQGKKKEGTSGESNQNGHGATHTNFPVVSASASALPGHSH